MAPLVARFMGDAGRLVARLVGDPGRLDKNGLNEASALGLLGETCVGIASDKEFNPAVSDGVSGVFASERERCLEGVLGLWDMLVSGKDTAGTQVPGSRTCSHVTAT